MLTITKKFVEKNSGNTPLNFFHYYFIDFNQCYQIDNYMKKNKNICFE